MLENYLPQYRQCCFAMTINSVTSLPAVLFLIVTFGRQSGTIVNLYLSITILYVLFLFSLFLLVAWYRSLGTDSVSYGIDQLLNTLIGVSTTSKGIV